MLSELRSLVNGLLVSNQQASRAGFASTAAMVVLLALLTGSLLFALYVGVAGFPPVDEMAMPVDAKVNVAYPVSLDARLAHEHLMSMLEGDAIATNGFQSLSDARLALRALACARGADIGRLDTLAAVKARPIDDDCFRRQDDELLTFYGVRTIGVLLAMPSLRPMASNDAVSTSTSTSTTTSTAGRLAAMASEAGVALLRDDFFDATVVEHPGGKLIARLPHMDFMEPPESSLSPNGRVLATSSASLGTVFHDTETGRQVWNAGARGRLVTWLPDLPGFMMSGADGQALLADGWTGSLRPAEATVRRAAGESRLAAH